MDSGCGRGSSHNRPLPHTPLDLLAALTVAPQSLPQAPLLPLAPSVLVLTGFRSGFPSLLSLHRDSQSEVTKPPRLQGPCVLLPWGATCYVCVPVYVFLRRAVAFTLGDRLQLCWYLIFACLGECGHAPARSWSDCSSFPWNS